MRKDPLFCDFNYRLITDTAHLKAIDEAKRKNQPMPEVQHVLDIRALFIARAGKRLILSDLSQIEPRVLAWLVGDKAMLAGLASGQSPYESHARATMGWAGGEMKKEDKDGYALAKARVLGLGFQCGWKKFITAAQDMAGLDITANDPEWVQSEVDGLPCFDTEGKPIMESGYGFNSKRVVKEFRESNPLIVGLWERLDDAFRGSVGGDFEMLLPSGRSMRYPEVRRQKRMAADPDNPRVLKAKWETSALAFDQKRNAVIRKPFYGGILTENLVQATAREVFGEMCIELQDTPGIDVLWTVHDEAVCEVDEGVTKADIETIMGKTPEWLEGCPLSAEAEEVKCYKK